MNVVLQCLSNSPPVRTGVRILSAKGVFEEVEAAAAGAALAATKTPRRSSKSGGGGAAPPSTASRKKKAEAAIDEGFNKLRRRSTMDCREVMERKPENLKRRGTKARGAAAAASAGGDSANENTTPVSYTHLTLPTKRIV